MVMGLETLDLAGIHHQAWITLNLLGDSPSVSKAMIRRAGTFFAGAIMPIEKSNRTAGKARVHLDRLNRTLRQRSEDLTVSKRQLRQESLRRKSAESFLKRNERHFGDMLEQSREMQEQMRLLSRQLLSAQEEERKRISRELHDVIAQTLAGITVQLAALKKEAAVSNQGFERNIACTQQLVQQSVDIVHQFARELRPTVLDDLGLIPALHTFMKNFREQTGIRVSLSTFAAVEQVNGDKRTVLFRVAQEALTNVARHAHASEAEVTIQRIDGAVCMKIKDNGKGFHQERLPHGKKNKRLGLLGMRERVEMVYGQFAVESAPRTGTTVQVRIPLTNHAHQGRKTP